MHYLVSKDFTLSCSAVGSQDDLPSSPEEWLIVIKLAHMWEFDDVLRNSIDRIQYHSVKMRPVEKVALALQYDMQEWLVLGLDELAKRPEPIGIEDVDLLGLDIALKVAAVRESLRMGTKMIRGETWTSQIPCLVSGPRDASEIDFTNTVKNIFQISTKTKKVRILIRASFICSSPHQGRRSCWI